MPSNSWVVGGLYYGGLQNGIPFWTQPGGAGTQVFPTSGQSAPFEAYPIQGLVFTFSPWFIFGCGHLFKEIKVVQDYNYETESLTQLLLCPQCGYVQRNQDYQQDQPISPGAGGGFYNPYYIPIIVG